MTLGRDDASLEPTHTLADLTAAPEDSVHMRDGVRQCDRHVTGVHGFGRRAISRSELRNPLPGRCDACKALPKTPSRAPQGQRASAAFATGHSHTYRHCGIPAVINRA